MLLLGDDRIDEACDRYAAAGENQWGFDDATWRRLARELRDRQEQTAERRGTISYSDLVAGTPVADLDHWFHIIGDLLVVVADPAHEARLPVLTAVATKKTGDRPGGGFYDAPGTSVSSLPAPATRKPFGCASSTGSTSSSARPAEPDQRRHRATSPAIRRSLLGQGAGVSHTTARARSWAAYTSR